MNDGVLILMVLFVFFAAVYLIEAVGVGIEDLTRKMSVRMERRNQDFVNEYGYDSIYDFIESVHYFGGVVKYHKYVGSFLYTRRFMRKFKRQHIAGNKETNY